MTNPAFSLFPRIVPADHPVELIIAPQDGHTLSELGEFELYYRAHEGVLPDGGITPDTVAHPVPPWRIADGKIIISGVFAGEQEHTIRLMEKSSAARPKVLVQFRIYSLFADWHGLLPYRGNFHQHSTNSRCCHETEDTPAYVVAASRMIGLDFTTVSDHSYYDSVRQAKDAFAGLHLPITLFPGEEVHPMQWSCHLVNFGGKFGVCDFIEKHKEQFYAEVAAIQQSYCDMPSGLDTFVMAADDWAFAKIREAGGIAILAHPCWYYHVLGGLMVPPVLTAQIIRRHQYDAMEVISGFKKDIMEYNNRQVTLYYEELAAGNRIAPLGVNDSHDCNSDDSDFDWYSTVLLLSGELSLENIREALSDFRSAAVESLPGIVPRAYCESRLQKYVLFLLREYFPYHDEICRAEGVLLHDFLRHGVCDAGELARCERERKNYINLFTGRNGE